MPVISYQTSVNDKRWGKIFPEYEQVIDKCLKHIKAKGELSILLTNDKEIQALNKTYRGKNKPTNVLSFPQDAPLLGDVVMALETLKREAKEQDKTFHDHFCHLFIHGVLHLLGYDHENDKDQDKMESHEKKILHKLGIANPYI